MVNLDKSGANTDGIKTWNKRSFTRKKKKIRRVKYLNNIIEQDHRSIKRRRISTGFKEFKAAQIILAGIEVIKYD